MAILRQGPSGPPINGANPGDVLIWDGTQWLPGASSGLPPGTDLGQLLQWDGAAWILIDGSANLGDVLVWDGAEWVPAALTGETAWDFIIEDVADFPNPPAAGFIDLVDGSYAIKAGIDIGANTIRVPGGVGVLMKGMGAFNEKFIDSDSALATVQVANGASARFETLNLDNSVGDGLLVQGALQSVGCQFSGNARGVYVNDGAWRDSLSRISSGTDGLFCDGGTLELVDTRLLGGSNRGLHLAGGNVSIAELQNCLIQSSNDVAFLLNCSDADVELAGCDINSLVGNTTGCIHVLEASTLVFRGGMWRSLSALRGNGLNIDGDISGGLVVLGVSAEDISTSDGSGEAFIKYTSGTVRRATVGHCNTATSVSTAVNWPAASIPTLGLALVGNLWDDPSPYVGFTSASARVNAKANIDQGGLMTETAIVP